jgi:hypothetical protein
MSPPHQLLTVTSSWVIWFFKKKFDLGDGMLGSLFFTTSIIAAASMLVASSIAKRFGNIKVRTGAHPILSSTAGLT